MDLGFETVLAEGMSAHGEEARGVKIGVSQMAGWAPELFHVYNLLKGSNNNLIISLTGRSFLFFRQLSYCQMVYSLLDFGPIGSWLEEMPI